jgi:inward rectifier potassium channel
MGGTEPRRAIRRYGRDDLVRIGAPGTVAGEMYFLLMDGSWPVFLGFLGGTFLFTNLVFGLLYMIDPGGVVNMRPGSLLDAVAFSVQTMATIGYGYMAPTDAWSNALVIIESMFGMIMTASYTGLFFARLSRPRANVVYSEPVLIHVHDGQKVLLFRVANGRGNEVVEATMRVTVLVDTVTAEGTEMRRLIDLKLVRDNSPLFRMSWTVMHVIDAHSPLHGITAETADQKIVAMICMMTAFDATYGQTTHARHIYQPADLRFGERFVDITSVDDQGRMVLDYTKFNHTKKDAAV